MAKIIVDARFYGLENTGLGRYTNNVLQYLPQYCAKDELYILLRRQYLDSLKLPKSCHPILAEVPHYSLREQIILPKLIDELKGDLFYSLHFNVPIWLNTPYVVTIHDLIKSHFDSVATTTRSPLIYRLKRLGYDKVMRHTVDHAKNIITPTNTVKNDILALYNADPTHILPISEAPDPIFRVSRKPAPLSGLPINYYLYVGNAYPHKNLQLIFDAFAQNELELVLVAKATPYLTKLLASIPPKLKKRITLLHSVGDKDLVSLYAHATALITPSLMEGYGLPGIEALMLGTPVLASNIPVYREVYEDKVTYFDPHSPADLLRAIKSVGKKSNRPLIINRTWEDVAREISEVLHASCSRI